MFFSLSDLQEELEVEAEAEQDFTGILQWVGEGRHLLEVRHSPTNLFKSNISAEIKIHYEILPGDSQCAACGALANFMCSACKGVHYCSTQCQVQTFIIMLSFYILIFFLLPTVVYSVEPNTRDLDHIDSHHHARSSD